MGPWVETGKVGSCTSELEFAHFLASIRVAARVLQRADTDCLQHWMQQDDDRGDGPKARVSTRGAPLGRAVTSRLLLRKEQQRTQSRFGITANSYP